MTRPGRSDLSPLERAAGVFTPRQREKKREIEINREGMDRKRECVHRGRVLVMVGGVGCLLAL